MNRSSMARESKKHRDSEAELRRVAREVRARSGGNCEIGTAECTGRAAEIPHHRQLRKQGGGHTLENLLDACPTCHRFAHNNPAVAFEKGWLVHEWDDPADVAVHPA